MKNNQAFSLIELLIVVLIVGVLVAIALPNYQFAVLKTQFRPWFNHMKILARAEELYFLQAGKYTVNPSKLDISQICMGIDNIVCNEDIMIDLLAGNGDTSNPGSAFLVLHYCPKKAKEGYGPCTSNATMSYRIHLARSGTPDKVICSGTSKFKKICQSLSQP